MRLNLNPEQMRALKVVRSAYKHRQVIGNFPDFLILGPQRTGTTWLHTQLELHPSIYISFPKELYFFNKLHRSPWFSKHASDLAFGKALLKMEFSRAFREFAKIAYIDVLKTRHLPAYSIEWYLRFFADSPRYARERDRKFQSLYGEPYRPTVYGEATATYATLDEVIIHDIVTLNPNLRAILMIRDPVERAWSHAKKDLLSSGGRNIRSIPSQIFLNFFSDAYQMACGDYFRHIELWEKYLAPGNLKVCFYDDIGHSPEALLLDVFTFLGVESSVRFISTKSRERVNPTAAMDIPPHFKGYLESLFADTRRELEIRFDREWPWR